MAESESYIAGEPAPSSARRYQTPSTLLQASGTVAVFTTGFAGLPGSVILARTFT